MSNLSDKPDYLREIQSLSNERLALWRSAGHKPLTEGQIERINRIADRLLILWNDHRRQLAQESRYNKEPYYHHRIA